MKKLRIILLSCLFIAAGTVSLMARITVTGTAPTSSNIPDGTIETPFNNALDETRKTLAKYGDQKDLVLGFANAGVYASQVANQWGYQGYDTFAVTIGTMGGGQLPSASPSGISDEFDKLKDDGDIYLGAAWQMWAAQVGINADFLLDDLYLGVKFGVLSMDVGDFNFDSLTFGVLANYQIFEEKEVVLGLIKWRGLSVGSGLIYQKNDTSYALDLDTLESGTFEAATGYSGTVTLDQSIDLGVETWSMSIPVEVTTAVRLLYFLNLSVGLGADLSFGGSEIILKSGGDTNLTGGLANVQETSGNVKIDGGTEGDGPNFIRPRIMAGIGFGVGPVMIDVPVAWYLNSGFSLGLSLGVVW